MLDRVTAGDFEPLVGAEFVATWPGQAEWRFVLTEVRPLREPPASSGLPRRKPFGLLFAVATPDYLPQGTYTLTHDRLGPLDIFLVPVGRDADGLLLEAIFN